jgi:hypothetical protein
VATRTPEPVAAETCLALDRFVDDLAWVGEDRLVVALTDDQLVGTIAFLDPVSGALSPLAQGIDVGLMVVLAPTRTGAVWSPMTSGSSAIWASGDGESHQLMASALRDLMDIAWTETGMFVAGVAPNAPERLQVARLADDGTMAALHRDGHGMTASEVWASLDGSIIVTVETIAPEIAPDAAQVVNVWRDGDPAQLRLPGEGGSRFAMTEDGTSILYRETATGDFVSFDLGSGQLRALAVHIDAAAVSTFGRLAVARRSSNRATSRVCISEAGEQVRDQLDQQPSGHARAGPG